MSTSQTRTHGTFIHAKPAYLDVWPAGPTFGQQRHEEAEHLSNQNQRLFNRSGFFLLQLACLVGRAPDLRRRKRRPIRIRVFVPASPDVTKEALTSQVEEVLQGLRIEVIWLLSVNLNL